MRWISAAGLVEFLVDLKSRGWRVVGQEVSANAARLAIEAGTGHTYV